MARPGQIGSGLARLQAVAQEHGVELLFPGEEAGKHGVDVSADASTADLAVVLGGDGTVLRALTRFLGSGVPVIGVNFGRVGFLSSMGRRDLDPASGASSPASTTSSSCRRSSSSIRTDVPSPSTTWSSRAPRSAA